MRDLTLRNMILGLMLASILGLMACGNDTEARGGAEAQGTASGSTDAAYSSDSAESAGSLEPGAEDSHPVVLAQGAEIEVTDYLAEGNITVIDFYSEFCPPCRRIAPYLLKLHQEREDITVVKIDINRPGVKGIDWGSPVAKQYRLQSIPHFQVYDAEGRLLAEGREAMGLIQGYMEGKS